MLFGYDGDVISEQEEIGMLEEDNNIEDADIVVDLSGGKLAIEEYKKRIKQHITYCFDIFRDMNIEQAGHGLIKLNFEKAVTQLVGIIKCAYDGKLYKITVEWENEHSST